jgi:hypothetical protein
MVAPTRSRVLSVCKRAFNRNQEFTTMAVTTLLSRPTQIKYLADGVGLGTLGEFKITFPYLANSHIKVFLNDAAANVSDGTLQVEGTNYLIRDGKGANLDQHWVEWITASEPDNTDVVTIRRETPTALVAPNPVIGNVQAIQAFYMMQEQLDRPVIVQFDYPQTELLAPTNIEAIAPVSGRVGRVWAIIKTAVTTGGALTFNIVTVAIDGASLTVADAAAQGVIYSDYPTYDHASTFVQRGERMECVAAAAFATAGALVAYAEIWPEPTIA